MNILYLLPPFFMHLFFLLPSLIFSLVFPDFHYLSSFSSLYSTKSFYFAILHFSSPKCRLRFFPLISLSVSSRSPENAHPFHVIYPSPSNGYNHPLLTPSPLPIYLHPANPIPDHHRNPLRLKWPTSFFPECQIFGIS